VDRLLKTENSKGNSETCGMYYKSFTIVINDHDSGQYYKTTITIVSYAPNLALALDSVVSYDHECCHNLEHHLLTMLGASFTIGLCL